MSTLRIEVPRKLKPLLAPKRYKGAYGGRGGAKSHFFAEQSIVKCFAGHARGVCIREVQNSIKDSVKQLLSDKIVKLGVSDYFEILDTEIRGPNNSLLIFKGMQSYNAANIKSLEAYDFGWVEEAQTLSQHSLDLLRPTIRKEGSELWFSWNPRHKTDPVDAFFRSKQREDAISVFINWRDNPWFPDVLHKEMLQDFEDDPDKAEHIWNGAYGSSQGAILARWVNKAEREGRLNKEIEFDVNGAPLEIISDIGFRDTASWWFWQRRVGGFALLNYIGESGLDADDWCVELMNKLNEMGISRRHLGKIWLPTDAKAKTFQSKYSSVERFLKAFGTDKVAIIPPSKKSDQISAARLIINRCEFDARCDAGLDGLRAWEYEWIEDLNVFSREPLHNWASHPGDAYAYGCQIMQEHIEVKKEEQPMRGLTVGNVHGVTLNEMWASTPKKRQRI